MQNLHRFIETHTLRFLLSLSTVIVMTPLAIMIIYLGHEQFQNKKYEVTLHAKELASRFGDKYEDDIRNTRILLEVIASQPDLTIQSPASLSKQFQNIIDLNPQYASLTLAKPDGYLRASSADNNPSINYSDREPFQVVIREGRFAVSEALVGLASRRAILPFSGPVKNSESQVAGVLLMGLRLEEYDNYFAKLHIPEGFRFVLFNEHGTRLLRFPRRDVSPTGQKMIPSAWESIESQQKDRGVFETQDQTGLDMTYAYIKFWPKDGGKDYLGVLVGIPTPQWISLFWPVFGQVILLIFGMTITSMIINNFLSKRIVTAGVEALAKGAALIAKRERLDKIEGLAGSKEIVALGSSFLEMSKSLDNVERKLQLESQRLKNLLQTATDGIHVVDQYGNLVLCSPSFAQMLGYTMEEATRLNVADWDVYFPADELIPKIQRTIDTQSFFETRHRRKDGTILDVAINARGIELDGKELLYASARDVSKQKQAEEALRKSEFRLRSITDSAHDAVLMMSPKGQISFWNPAAERLFGYSQEEAIGRDLHLLLAPKRYHDASNASLQNFYETGQGNAVGKVLDLAAIRKDGVEISISLSLAAHKIGNGWHAIGIVRDTTELRRLEQVKDDVERIVRHDLKTPLTGLINIPGLLMDDANLTSDQRQMLGLVEISAKKMLGLINSSLEIYKIESGAYSLLPKECYPARLVRDNIGILTRDARIDPEQIILRDYTADSGGSRAYLKTDELLLDIILMNLMRNALEASDKGEKVTVDLSEDAKACTISISNAKAVPAEIRDRFFEKYSTAKKSGGTGLGTYSAYIMTRALGGTIEMETSDETGTKFTVLIPKAM